MFLLLFAAVAGGIFRAISRLGMGRRTRRIDAAVKACDLPMATTALKELEDYIERAIAKKLAQAKREASGKWTKAGKDSVMQDAGEAEQELRETLQRNRLKVAQLKESVGGEE